MLLRGKVCQSHDCITNVINPHTHVTDGRTVTSGSASLKLKTCAATFCPCQIALNRKVSHIVYVISR